VKESERERKSERGERGVKIEDRRGDRKRNRYVHYGHF
jgi:hypothetical protein